LPRKAYVKVKLAKVQAAHTNRIPPINGSMKQSSNHPAFLATNPNDLFVQLPIDHTKSGSFTAVKSSRSPKI